MIQSTTFTRRVRRMGAETIARALDNKAYLFLAAMLARTMPGAWQQGRDAGAPRYRERPVSALLCRLRRWGCPRRAAAARSVLWGDGEWRTRPDTEADARQLDADARDRGEADRGGSMDLEQETEPAGPADRDLPRRPDQPLPDPLDNRLDRSLLPPRGELPPPAGNKTPLSKHGLRRPALHTQLLRPTARAR